MFVPPWGQYLKVDQPLEYIAILQDVLVRSKLGRTHSTGKGGDQGSGVGECEGSEYQRFLAARSHGSFPGNRHSLLFRMRHHIDPVRTIWSPAPRSMIGSVVEL